MDFYYCPILGLQFTSGSHIYIANPIRDYKLLLSLKSIAFVNSVLSNPKKKFYDITTNSIL